MWEKLAQQKIQFSRLVIWCPPLLCVVFVTLMCAFGCLGVRNFLFLHLSFSGVLCICVPMYIQANACHRFLPHLDILNQKNNMQ